MAASDIEHLHQLAVHAYYVGEHDVGRRACERLLAEQITPERERLVRRNRTWYTRQLGDYCDVELQQIDIQPARPGWSLFNPSIVARGSGYDLLVRSSNYAYDGRSYAIPAQDNGQVKTENVLVRLDADLVPQVVTPLTAEYPRNGYHCQGLEDCRLNYADGRTTISATICDHEGTAGYAMIGLGEIVGDRIEGIVVPPSPLATRHEKNWMPILGTASYLYSCWEDSWTVTAVLHEGRWVLRRGGSSPWLARSFRGGSQLIPCEDGWLSVVHEVGEIDRQPNEGLSRVYEHRFVWFDRGLAITHVSPPFFLKDRHTVEFVGGMACGGDSLVLTFGIYDTTAWLARINYADIHAARVAV